MVCYRESEVKRILLITDLYPPDPGGRSEKMSRHVKYFFKKKVKIDVLCPTTSHAPTRYYLDSDKNNICWRIPPFFYKHLLSLKWQENFMPQTFWGKFLIRSKIIPLGYLRWIFPAYLYTKKLIFKRNIGLIITVSNPITMLLLGVLLKLTHPHLKFVAELRDPVTSCYRSKSDNFLAKIVERLVIKYADLIIEWKDFSSILLKDKYKLTSSYLCIENVGYDPEEWIEYRRTFSLSKDFPIKLIYTGGYYHDIVLWKLIFSAISKLIIKKIPIVLEYFGDWVEEQKMLLSDFPLLSDKVVIHGRVEKKICIKAYENCDALLYLLYPSSENIFKVTSKIYDYIASGKPIIGILPKNSASESILKKYSPYWLISLPSDWDKKFEYFEEELIKKIMFLYEIKRQNKNLKDFINYSIIPELSCEKSETIFVNSCLSLLNR